ncbi:hypothetical protein [Niabella aquatica]
MELHRIIELISPEIIFEELCHSNFHKSYVGERLITVETNAIKLYLLNHDITHIPVDTLPLPSSYYEELDYMYKKIRSHRSSESHSFRISVENQISLTSQYGFAFLNSDQNDSLIDQFKVLKEKVLNNINDENLYRIYKMEQEVIDKREEEIIRNIYNYSKQHQYKQALLLLGAGHRASFIKKIEKYKVEEELKLNWEIHTK